MKQTLKQFFEDYGCTMTRADGRTVKGICTCLTTPRADDGRLGFAKLGFTVKQEYLLITADADFLQKNDRVRVADKQFFIAVVDNTMFSDEVLCYRGYACEERGDLL